MGQYPFFSFLQDTYYTETYTEHSVWNLLQYQDCSVSFYSIKLLYRSGNKDLI